MANETMTSLARDLYKLALQSHAPEEPCDDDIECEECTLLLIASEVLKEPEPWESGEVRELVDGECMNPRCEHDGECCGPYGEHHRPILAKPGNTR